MDLLVIAKEQVTTLYEVGFTLNKCSISLYRCLYDDAFGTLVLGFLKLYLSNPLSIMGDCMEVATSGYLKRQLQVATCFMFLLLAN